MNATGIMKIAIFTIIVTLAAGTSQAADRRWHHRPHQAVTVVSRPAVSVHVSHRFSQKERLAMAIAYLKEHRCLTVNQYAKMTRLNKASAKAELDAFASDRKKPIAATVKGKKKVYVIRNR